MLKRELKIFLIVGGLTVLVDFTTYRGLIWFATLNVNHAKAMGFITGTIFAYFANRLWTFNHHQHAPGSIGRFAILYLLTLSVNIWINASLLTLFKTTIGAVQLAFLVATGVSAILNFLGMKYLVFKKLTKN